MSFQYFLDAFRHLLDAFFVLCNFAHKNFFLVWLSIVLRCRMLLEGI
uniref:Uncharacterized protein n=1 Tax=Rhizophora mucronata TaxID=61149 RepID=A0A2P2R3G2_RHIMU